MDNWNSFKFY